tara:strand:- start:3927 stop:4034 length:108 start_codon:yes stop_codon:yes gene_type:complete
MFEFIAGISAGIVVGVILTVVFMWKIVENFKKDNE